MLTPTIEVLGVYRLPVTDELVQRDFEIRWESSEPGFDRAEAIRQCRKELESVVLVELVVRNPDQRFRIEDFTQTNETIPPSEWQAPWEEAYLSVDGLSHLGKSRRSKPVNVETVRVAFYMHFWSSDTPLSTSYGSVACPSPQSMPQRLLHLAPYEILG